MNEITIIEQDQLISEAMERDEPRLRSFIRKRVSDSGEAEDILQDVFFELIEAYRLMKPIEQVTAWLFRVARNRIIDLFRKKKPGSLNEPLSDEDGDTLEDLLPSPTKAPKPPTPEPSSSMRSKKLSRNSHPSSATSSSLMNSSVKASKNSLPRPVSV